MTIAYHGSSVHNLKNLEFKVEHSRFINALDFTYGHAIYLAAEESIARNYATHSLYTIEINGNIFDNTNTESIYKVMSDLAIFLNQDKNYFKEVDLVESTIKGISEGDYIDIFEQIRLIVDSDQYLYENILDSLNGEDPSDKIREFEENFIKMNPVFKYLDKSLGYLYICYDKNGDCLNIVNEEIIESN